MKIPPELLGLPHAHPQPPTHVIDLLDVAFPWHEGQSWNRLLRSLICTDDTAEQTLSVRLL